MNNQFFSSLVINGRKFPHVHQVFKPRYNKEFFKRVVVKIDELNDLIEKRCPTQPPKITCDAKNLKNDVSKLIKLREQYEKLEKKTVTDGEALVNPKLEEIKTQLEPLEDRLLPFAVDIPNRYSKNVPTDGDILLDTCESDIRAVNENLSKILSHIKLSYINKCYSKSVVGPNSHYYSGIGAKVQYGISDYFGEELESKDFVRLSGLCLTKSAVVEASNSNSIKDFKTDPCRIITEDDKYTTIHLVEASREALLAFITTIGPKTSNSSLRLMTAGAGYRSGTDWFDSSSNRVSQFETLHTLTLCPSMESHSMREYEETRSIIWTLYKRLKLPTRLMQCSLESMHPNEYDASRIDIFLPHSERWVQVARISHYSNYLTVRCGMKRGHIVDSMVFDGQALFAAIIENNQTSTGKFIIPCAIKKHMIHLNQNEQAEYFRKPSSGYSNISPSARVMNNYDQKRYIAKKKSYVYGHSKFAERANSGGRRRAYAGLFCLIMLIYIRFDWVEIFARYFPRPLKRLSYDYLYRPVRNIWWSITYTDPSKKPKDLTFDEKDWSWTELSRIDRNREIIDTYVEPRHKKN